MNLDANSYLNLVRGGAASLAESRKTINDLNVFPIPDGDTGDNMYMTIEAGSHGSGTIIADMAASVSKGMLMGARGNSGVILSRIFAGMAKGLQGYREADVQVFAQAMHEAVNEAYHAVSQPVEGTILTVLREGVKAAEGSSTLEEYFDLMIAGMDLSLQHTPELLDVLKKAGVVDSGGAGLLCIAEGMRSALHGETVSLLETPQAKAADIDFNAFTEDSVLEFGYCTEFLLRLQRSKVDLDSFDESVIRDYLASQGDSLVFFRDGSIVKVHVHTKDPGAILTRCREWGEYLTIKVENMTLQHHENHMDERFHSVRKPLGVVAVANGEGFCQSFREMGADAIIPGGQTMNPPVEKFLEAFDSIDADTILVFPNNSNILLTAEQAASIYSKEGVHIEVIPSRSLAQGYFALANLDMDMAPEDIPAAMTEAVGAVTDGLVSRAVRDADGVREGEYIGISGKQILCSSPTPEEAVMSLAEAIDAAGADIITLFSGAGTSAEKVAALKTSLEKKYPLAEVILSDGGQKVYDYILMIC